MKEIKREVEHLCKLEHPNVVRYYHLVSILLRNLFTRKCYNILIYLLECIFINLLAGMYPFLFFLLPRLSYYTRLTRLVSNCQDLTIYFYGYCVFSYFNSINVCTYKQTDRQRYRQTKIQTDKQKTIHTEIQLYKDNVMQCEVTTKSYSYH